jgi:DNA-binding response OmpR family regulator
VLPAPAHARYSAVIRPLLSTSTRPIVLVVEDDLAVRGPLEKFLALRGFDVVSADTADAALDRLRERPCQGAVVDLRLSSGSGREVILSIPPPTPVIIFSAVPDESGQLEQMRANTRLILKPFSLMMLTETLQGMMDATARNDPATRA